MRNTTKTQIHAQVEEYLYYCRFVRNMSEQTMVSKYHVFLHFEKDCGVQDLKDFDNKQMNQWIAGLVASGTLAGRSINTKIAHVKAMIKYHREMGLVIPVKLPIIEDVPEDPPRRVFYTREQIWQVLALANDLQWLLIRIKFDTGMRISELQHLQVSNLRKREVKGLVMNEISYIGKGRKLRKSYICDDTMEKLEHFISTRKIEGYLWPSPDRYHRKGLPYGKDQIRRIMSEPFLAAGFADFYPHAMRHSFGTDIENNGASYQEAQRLLGHSRIETTQGYLHALNGREGELFQKYKQGMFATA